MARLPDSAVRRRWEERIQSFEQSDLTVVDFCERLSVSTASFYLWRKKLRDTAEPSAAFLPVTVNSAARECFRIRFANDVTVEVPAGEAETLLRVVDRLAADGGREPQS
jgi:hypothetical protein